MENYGDDDDDDDDVFPQESPEVQWFQGFWGCKSWMGRFHFPMTIHPKNNAFTRWGAQSVFQVGFSHFVLAMHALIP